jgi:hypothetical protein
VNEILENLVAYTGIALGGYSALLVGMQAFQDLASEKIKSQEQLDKIVDEETGILGMNKRTVVAKFYAIGQEDHKKIRGARCYVENFNFEGGTIPFKVVEIKEGWGARRGAVRHELYHLQNHLPGKRRNVLKSFFYEEPTATLYAIAGIKL